MSKRMVLPKIIKLGKRHSNGNPNFTDGELNEWHVSNEQYTKLTKRQQRMVIAADVVALLDSRKIAAQHGRYVALAVHGGALKEIEASAGSFRGEVDARTLVRKLMEKKSAAPACKVCAIGSVFLANLERVNTLKVTTGLSIYGEPLSEASLSREASDLSFVAHKGPFCADQQRVMERCFEDQNTWNPRMRSATRRIRSIMMNIISNKGVLKIYTRAPVRRSFAATVDVKDVRW